MANLRKITAVWSGWAGGPGVNTFYVLGGSSHLVEFTAFYNTFEASLPSGVAVTLEETGVIVDEVTGDLTGGWTEEAGTAAAGSDTGGFAAGVGCTVQWRTASILNGRRVIGHTYLVPIGRSCYQTDGTIAEANRASFQDAADTLLADLDESLVVWHRPVSGAGGAAALVTSAAVPDRPAILRSRRP